MFSFPAAKRYVLGQLRAFAVVITLGLWSVGAIHAQSAPLEVDPPKLRTHAALHESLLPESGYLSDATYTNNFFGFALDLPIAAPGHLIKLPLMPEGQHALLAIGYQNGGHSGSLTIDAIEPHEGREGFSAKQQQLTTRAPGTIQSGAQGEPQVQPQVGPHGTLVAPQARLGMPEFQVPEERFHSSVRRRGQKYTALYWAQLKNYRVGVLVATNDRDFLQKARQAMEALRFYCTVDGGTLATKDGKLVRPAGEPYEGPTVPTWRVDAAIQAKPGLEIPPGEISEGVYRNAKVGLQYELPKGWEVLPAHNGGNPPADFAGLREFELLHACSRTLLRIEQKSSGDAAEHSRMPMIILRALDATCLSMRTPVVPSDKKIAEEVGVSLEALSEFGQVTSNDLVSILNYLFMVFHGTIAVPEEGEQLAQRMSQTMFATSRNQVLLVWSFIAPTSGELAAMPASGISLVGSQSIELGPAVSAHR